MRRIARSDKPDSMPRLATKGRKVGKSKGEKQTKRQVKHEVTGRNQVKEGEEGEEEGKVQEAERAQRRGREQAGPTKEKIGVQETKEKKKPS